MEVFVSLLLLLILVAASPVVTALQCLSCQDIVVDSDNKLVNTAFSVISQRNQQCISSDVSANTPNVQLKTCAPPSSGKVAKCALINGRSTSSLIGVQFGLTVRARTCVEADPSTTDTCREGHNDVEDEGFIAEILSVVRFLSVDSYQGTTCFCSYDGCVSGQTKSASGIVTWCVSLLVACMLNLFCGI